MKVRALVAVFGLSVFTICFSYHIAGATLRPLSPEELAIQVGAKCPPCGSVFAHQPTGCGAAKIPCTMGDGFDVTIGPIVRHIRSGCKNDPGNFETEACPRSSRPKRGRRGPSNLGSQEDQCDTVQKLTCVPRLLAGRWETYVGPLGQTWQTWVPRLSTCVGNAWAADYVCGGGTIDWCFVVECQAQR